MFEAPGAIQPTCFLCSERCLIRFCTFWTVLAVYLFLWQEMVLQMCIPSGSCSQMGNKAGFRSSNLIYFRNEIVFQASGIHWLEACPLNWWSALHSVSKMKEQKGLKQWRGRVNGHLLFRSVAVLETCSELQIQPPDRLLEIKTTLLLAQGHIL